MSNLRVTNLRGRTAGSSPTLPDGAVVTGIVTATSFSGAVTGNISGGTVAGSTGSFTGDVDIADKIVHTGDTNTAIRFPAADTFTVETAGSEAARFDSSGRLLMGRTTSQNDNIGGIGYANLVQIEGSATGSGLAVSNTGGTARININREYTPSNGDDLAYLSFGAETTSVERARITCAAEFTNANTRGGRLIFSTCADSAHDPTERLRITSGGNIGIGGLTNPQDYHANANSLVSSGGITLANTSGGYIYFADSATGTGEYVGQIGYDHGSDYMNFVVNNGERLRIQSGGGISFNGDTAAANALDDYEEGTWTPTLTDGYTRTYSIQNGVYIKVGRLVYLRCQLQGSTRSGSAASYAYITLPFPASGMSGAMQPSALCHTSSITHTDIISGAPQWDQPTEFRIYETVGGQSYIAPSAIAAAFQIGWTFTYMTT